MSVALPRFPEPVAQGGRSGGAASVSDDTPAGIPGSADHIDGMRIASGNLDRTSLDAMVDELERHLPRMLKAQDAPPGFWTWFAGEAASIGRNARSRADWLHVRDRLSAIVEYLDAEKPPRKPRE